MCGQPIEEQLLHGEQYVLESTGGRRTEGREGCCEDGEVQGVTSDGWMGGSDVYV